MTKIKRLFWDIEVSPNVVLSWRVGHKINIDCENIIKERAIICIGYKWEGEKSAHVLVWDKNQNDREMVKAFVEIANSADELVHHNGDSFDAPWLLTRCAFHGITALPAYKMVDTLQWARRRYLFNSNRLNYLGKYLGLGEKIKTEFGLWKNVLQNDAKALRTMAAYCARDVELLENVWHKLSMTMAPKTHAGVVGGRDKWTCPRDGSKHVKLAKTRISAAGTKQYQMQCLDCGGFYSISPKVFKEYQEYLKDKCSQKQKKPASSDSARK